MPQRKTPNKLFDKCLVIVDNLLDIACDNMESDFGVYSNEETQCAIISLQEFLTSYIPVSVLDEVFNIKKSGSFLNACCTGQRDIRILLALVLHQRMIIFKVTKLDIPKTLVSKIEESFWMFHLARMPHLVILDLSLVCTDQILEVVGHCCPLLEEVTVVSKMSRTSKGGDFNALRKVYLVTDKGLMYLTQCQKLKQISLNASNRSGLGNITEQGICQLICSLPNLRIINYEFMGSVLVHLPNNRPLLKLQQLKDLRSNPNNVATYSQLCPELIVLHLALPTNLTDSDREVQSEAIENILTNASLQLQILCLGFIHISNSILSSLLQSKGFKLTILNFGLGCNIFDSHTLIIIGNYCPNLVELAVNTMGPDTTTITFPKSNSVYNKLTNLSLSGNTDWKVEHSLLICLSGELVSHITLCGSQVDLDIIIARLIEMGRLRHLMGLVLHKHCFVSSETVWRLLRECPNLAKLYCLYHAELLLEDTETFQSYAQDNNLQLDLKFSDGSRSWH